MNQKEVNTDKATEIFNAAKGVLEKLKAQESYTMKMRAVDPEKYINFERDFVLDLIKIGLQYRIEQSEAKENAYKREFNQLMQSE